MIFHNLIGKIFFHSFLSFLIRYIIISPNKTNVIGVIIAIAEIYLGLIGY